MSRSEEKLKAQLFEGVTLCQLLSSNWRFEESIEDR